jgi:glycerol kinase
VGIASQRSTFALWQRDGGKPVTPLISWQDRRAADWVRRHAAACAALTPATGLVLSPHHAGPKLAALQESDAALRTALHAGELVWGTLETLLLWRWSDGGIHETDPTMAGRSGLLERAGGGWCPAALKLFDLPRTALPRLRPSDGADLQRSAGGRVTATLGDQPAAAVASLAPGGDDALVSLGTGGFILRREELVAAPRPGYLHGPLLAPAGAPVQHAVEGTINGCGPALDGLGPGPLLLPAEDPAPQAFALPDASGLGAPHWRPDLTLTFSVAAARLDVAGRRRAVLEGLLFRIAEILEDLFPDTPPARILLAGGLSRAPAVAAGLAALLQRPVAVLAGHEGALLGAARLAAGLPPAAGIPTRQVEPGPSGSYLPAKLPRWRNWLAGRLAD